MSEYIDKEIEFINKVKDHPSNTIVYILSIGSSYEGSDPLGVFEDYNLAKQFLNEDGRLKGVKNANETPDGWWRGHTEKYWGQIRPYKLLK